MANYVLEVRKQYGTFQNRVFAKGQAAPEFAGNDTSPTDMVASVKDGFKSAGVAADDTIYFRNIAYENHGDLLYVVRDAPY